MDNNRLSHLSTDKLWATEERWAAQLAAFEFTIKYRPGYINQNADGPYQRHQANAKPSDYVISGFPVLKDSSRQMEIIRQPVRLRPMAFPCHNLCCLHVLQDSDPTIEECRRFWTTRIGPDAAEQRQASIVLGRKWDKIVEPDCVLYCKSANPR